MAIKKTTAPAAGKKRKLPPARTPEARENQLINLAIDLVERQLQDGSASSQVITHFLKLATTREKLENEKLRSDLRVAEAKIKQYNSAEELKELYASAMEAMKGYSSQEDLEDDDDY